MRESIVGGLGTHWQRYNERERERYIQIIEGGEHRSILYDWTVFCTNEYAVRFAVLLVFVILVFVSPLLVSDRHRKVHYLHYSSKTGRRIIKSQIAATLLSAFAMTTVLVAIFGGIFSMNGTAVFWDCNINSEFNADMDSVFSMTYGQWIIAQIALMYALSLGVSMFAFVISRFSGNPIALAMKLIPLFAVAAYLSTAVIAESFGMLGNSLYYIFRVFGAEAYSSGIICAAALVTAAAVAAREKRVDVM